MVILPFFTLMKLQTKVPIVKQKNAIDYNSKLLLLGSCFVENIGSKLIEHKFQTLKNPLGIFFHPQALADFLHRVATKTYFTEEDVFYHHEQWSCFEAHSSCNASTASKLVITLNSAIDATYAFITTATHVVFTLGTAWVYEFQDTQKVVVNCHKQPKQKFIKRLLSVVEIETALEKCLASCLKLNDSLSCIATISPVRHEKDGLVANQRSKAHLCTALHSVIDKNNEVMGYFPAYEIVMDELRDYRFYSEDMLHPNQQAVNYIWQQFSAAYFSAATEKTVQRVHEVNLGLAHRPFNAESEAYVKFKAALSVKIKALQQEYPFITF